MAFFIPSFGSVGDLIRYVNGAAAQGLVVVPAPQHLSDGQTFTIDDGTNAASVFEMDVDGGGVSPGNVQVDVSAIAADDTTALATAIETAINGIAGTLTVTATAVGAKVSLVADTSDATHNVKITQSAAAIAFQIEGMAGGADVIAQANVLDIMHKDKRWYLQHDA